MVNSSTKDVKVPPPITAQDRSSFAYKTIKDRLPVILVKIIDFFHKQRKDLHSCLIYVDTATKFPDYKPKEAEEDAKEIIAQLAKIRKELETNKPAELFEKLDLEDDFSYFNDDIDIWNSALEEHRLDDGSLPRWFDSSWLLVECYLYRRIKEFCLKTKHLKMYDPFVEQKQQSTLIAVPQMIIVANHLKNVIKQINDSANKTLPSERIEFGLFMQLALWANKSDLSISDMDADKIKSGQLTADIRESLESLQENILCDNMSEAWFKFQAIKEKVKNQASNSESETKVFVDLVADNAGYEIYVDLCLLHFLTLMLGEDQSNVKFRIHLKRMPWFVSDALDHDIEWIISFLTAEDQNPALQTLGNQWKIYFEKGIWQISEHRFWTSPHDYSEMQKVSPDLHSLLSKSSFIIFKGDLNYRKLTGDRPWHLLTPFRVALRGFCPAPLVTLRTAKADVVVGIEDINIYAKINNNELPQNWRISGDYGLIQFLEPM